MSVRAQSDPGIIARLPELHPLTGDFGQPEDVAGAALYLATAPFVTGAVLTRRRRLVGPVRHLGLDLGGHVRQVGRARGRRGRRERPGRDPGARRAATP